MGNILSIDGICKSFSGIQVLKDVSLELEAGQIICLAGENGAGKSTLIKILSGAEKPDKGKITIFGTTYERMTPGQAMHLGIATIYQDADLVSSLTVSDNIFLGAVFIVNTKKALNSLEFNAFQSGESGI